MNILFAGECLNDPKGGGEISARTLLDLLSSKHTVRSFCMGEEEIPAILTVVPYHLRMVIIEWLYGKSLKKMVRKEPVDLLLLQQPAYISTRFLKRHQIPAVVFIHSYDYGIAEKQGSILRRFYNFPFRVLRFWKNKLFLKNINLIVFNSLFIKKWFRRFGVSSGVVVHPFVDMNRCKVPEDFVTSAQFVTFINAKEIKGLHIAVEIARLLPEQKFLFVRRKTDERLSDLPPNIEVKEWTKDIREVLKDTRLLIMPSFWEEPFGMLPIEAGFNGIPVLVSNTGGLPESVGKGGILIDDYTDSAVWAKMIKGVLNSEERYRDLSIAARDNALQKESVSQYRVFKEVVKEKCNRTL